MLHEQIAFAAHLTLVLSLVMIPAVLLALLGMKHQSRPFVVRLPISATFMFFWLAAASFVATFSIF